MRILLPVLLLTSTVLVCGCEDLVTVQVHLDPITMDRDLNIGEVPPDVCPSVSRTLEPTRALAGSATLAPLATRCVLTVRLEGAVLLDRAAVLALRERLEGSDTTALLGILVEVRELELTRAGGEPFDPESLHEIEVRLDDVPVVPPSRLDAPLDTMRVVLPQDVSDRLLAAIEEGTELRADLELRLAFVDSAAIPPWLRLRLVIAPSLLVDAVRAAL